MTTRGHLRWGRRSLFARKGFVVSHPFAKCANGWGTEGARDKRRSFDSAGRKERALLRSG